MFFCFFTASVPDCGVIAEIACPVARQSLPLCRVPHGASVVAGALAAQPQPAMVCRRFTGGHVLLGEMERLAGGRRRASSAFPVALR